MMLRKTLASLLLCSSLLVPACSKRADRAEAYAPPGGTAEIAKLTANEKASNAPAATGVSMGSAAGPGIAAHNGAYAYTTTAADGTSGEGYKDYGRNPWVDASKDHLSTFAADVDTASYSLARRKLLEG